MAIRAYSDVYLGCAQKNLGEMLRYGTEDAGIPVNSFFEMFLDSGIADMFGRGDYRYITGMSGVEVGYEVLRKMQHAVIFPKPSFHPRKSPVYWTGWILAYFQYFSDLPFRRIYECLKPNEIEKMYNPYHEMDPLQFVQEANRIMVERSRTARLKMYRERLGLSQSQLARESGCSVRMIQYYEQGRRDINKAQADTLLRMAVVLRCEPSELLEYRPATNI